MVGVTGTDRSVSIRDGRIVDRTIVVLLDPGITGGRTFAAFRAVSNIRTGCGGVFLTSGFDDGIVDAVDAGVDAVDAGVDIVVDDDDGEVSFVLLEHRCAVQRCFG